MKPNLALFLAALLFSLSGAANGADPARRLGVEASIAFPTHGTVRNFEADGDDGLWIEDQHRSWYYAKLTGFCPDLPYAQTIGIDAGGLARLDKFGAIVVGGHRCAFTSFVTAAEPLPRKERQRLAKEAQAASN